MTDWQDDWERRQAALDEYRADIAYERAWRYHVENHVDDGEPDYDCKFCKEETEEENDQKD